MRFQPLSKRLEIQPPVRFQGNDLQGRAHPARDLLPGHPVAVMLRRRHPYLVARTDLPARQTGRHQVDPRRRPGGKHHLLRRGRPEKSGHLGAGAFEGQRGFRAQLVHAAPGIRIVLAVELVHDPQHQLRPLGGRRVVQPGQFAPQNGELTPQPPRIESALPVL
jgi:hypothetical protein